MAPWQNDYLLSLQERDKKEKKFHGFYENCPWPKDAKLADRTAAADKKAVLQSNNDRSGTANIPLQTPGTRESIIKIRDDLAEAQRSREILQSHLQKISDELQKLKIQTALDNKRISELTSERASLTIKIRDRDEELRGKSKLLEDIHDETVSLTLQLNMAEEQAKALRQENKDLIDRWMARMGKEADAMNKASKFG
ncbi:MAG: hypothetical protein LQ351_007071 [Letrouitia transgressa]|nr:MAG: hypothetical protein LQ351_007071 [Letrouitia transgressa]